MTFIQQNDFLVEETQRFFLQVHEFDMKKWTLVQILTFVNELLFQDAIQKRYNNR